MVLLPPPSEVISITSITSIKPHIDIPTIFMKTISNLPTVLLLTVELMVVWLVPITRVLSIVPNAHVDITGISGSPIEQLPLVQCTTLVNTLDEGQVILIMSQYAHSSKGKTIHSKSLLESFGCSVHDSALRAGGKQCIYTPEGYVIPLHVRHGLFYMDM